MSFEEKSRKDRKKLLAELNVWKEKIESEKEVYESYVQSLSEPIPKFDRSILKDYQKLEERASRMKQSVDRLKEAINTKTKSNSMFKFGFNEIAGADNDDKRKRHKKNL